MQCLQWYTTFAIPLHQLFYPRGWSKHISKLARTLWVEGDTLTQVLVHPACCQSRNCYY